MNKKSFTYHLYLALATPLGDITWPHPNVDLKPLEGSHSFERRRLLTSFDWPVPCIAPIGQPEMSSVAL